MLSQFRSSLRYKISAQMLFLSLVPLAIVGATVYIVFASQLGQFSDRLGETEESLRSDVVGANLAGTADGLAAEIDAYLLERIKDVRRWAEAPEVIAVVRQANRTSLANGLATADKLEVESALDAQAEQGQSPYLLTLSGIGTEAGQELFSAAINFLFSEQEKTKGTFVEIIVTEASGINALITRPLVERVHREAQWWREASQQGLGGVGIGEAYLDEGTQHIVIDIALPVVDPDSKEVLGVIRGTLDLSGIQLLVSRRTALISGGQAQVFAQDASLLADTADEHDPDALLNSDLDQLARELGSAMTAMQTGMTPGFEVVTEDTGEGTTIIGYSNTRGSEFYDEPAALSGFAGFGWTVIVSQPEETALRVLTPLLDVRQTLVRQSSLISSVILLAAGLTSIVGLVVALFLARGIANPLVYLSRMAERVRAGDYDMQVTVTSEDEVGTLQAGFNLMVNGLEEREQMRDLFGRAVSPEVANLFLSGDLELGGEIRQVTILFSDIRGFTTLSEPLSPNQVIAFVNEFLDAMHEAIQGVGGVVNKLGGDSIMALFGAPADDPENPHKALQAALRMRTRLADLNQRRRARGDVELRIGIGINTGPVIAGGVGSEDRLEYTVLGDAVNVAARLESLTKDFSEHDILISEATLQALPDRDLLEAVDLGEVIVKGKTEPVRVFGVLRHRGMQT